MLKKIKRYLKDPYWALGSDLIKSHPNWMSDKFYICTLWRMVMGYKLNLSNPKTFNEKLQWLKLYNRNPLYTILVDKLLVKDWVADKIGSQYVVPTLAVYNSVDEINLENLPEQFVLKCNHDSGSVIICKDKSTFDLKAAKIKLSKALHQNFYKEAREWPYKNVSPKIFAEKYLCNNQMEKNNTEMTDYKFYCFHGESKFLYVSYGLSDHSSAKIAFLNLDYTYAPFYRDDFSTFNVLPPKPKSFKTLIELSNILSKDIPFVRVDWYDVEGIPYFSEMTFYPGGGTTKLTPFTYDERIGQWLDLNI